MALPIPNLLPGEIFYDYTVSQLWIGTQANGNQQIPVATLNGITFPDATVQTTAAIPTPPPVVPNIKTIRVNFGTIGSALISLPTTINWPTPFADNNYTIVGQCVIGEATSDGAVTSIINIASIELLAAGVGFIATIANADSIPHSCTGHFIAVHD